MIIWTCLGSSTAYLGLSTAYLSLVCRLSQTCGFFQILCRWQWGEDGIANYVLLPLPAESELDELFEHWVELLASALLTNTYTRLSGYVCAATSSKVAAWNGPPGVAESLSTLVLGLSFQARPV